MIRVKCDYLLEDFLFIHQILFFVFISNLILNLFVIFFFWKNHEEGRNI